MNLSENLKKIRKDNNLSQEQLAEKLGVSRQSVSKWESNQAYPEMDKMLQLCNLFNLNIDELLNQDIDSVNSNKQSKNNVNKFIESFLDYITKTIDMFSSIKFKDKIKCILEQIILICILIFIFGLMGIFLENIIRGLIISFPENIYYKLLRILESIYLIICLILGIVLILHIFKVRYLDYYIIVKNNNEYEEPKKDIKTEIKKDKQTIIEKEQTYINERKEKIIIRDPKHSEYKFISCLLKFLLFIVKTIIGIIAILFCLSFIFLIIISIISLLFIKTGFLFVGSLLTLISLISINIIILIILYNFILSKKNKSKRLALIFLISLMFIGIGIGLIIIGLSEFKIINNINSEHYIKEQNIIPMNEELILEDWHNYIEFIESNNTDLKIEYIHSKYTKISMNEYDNYYYFDIYPNYDKINIIKDCIEDINSKNIINYSLYKINIYTTKENINKLKNNKENYFNNEQENFYQDTINDYEQRIRNYLDKILEKDLKIEELEERISSLESNIINEIEY